MFIGVLFLIAIGGALGWLASLLLKAESGRLVLLNVAVGIAGAFLAAAVLNPLLGGGNILAGRYGEGALVTAIAGSIALLAIVNAARGGNLR